MKKNLIAAVSICASVSLHGDDVHRLVDSIYDALTPEERVAQICATSAGNLAGSDGRFSAEKARARIPHGIGHVCQFACNRTDEPEALAQFVRDVQAFCLNETRAGIPAICHEEVISGLAARTATTYPQQIAVASSWDAPLLERKCRETSEAMRAVGATFALSPMADVIVCAMGENFTLCGESRQRASIRLAGDQEKLVEAMIATGKPVVLVLFGGRNQVVSQFVDRCAAVLQAWYPGEEGGRAVAEILAGKVNPSGRLPMTYPKTESRDPLTFGDGSDTPERVQWPFGHGLSYTKFAYGHAELSSGAETRIGGVGDCVKTAVTVRNVGEMAGAEVVQLYITAKGEPVRLRGFARVALKPGEKKRVEFSVPLELFARWRGDGNGAWSVEPGEYEIRLGRDAWDKSRVLTVRLEGASLSFPRRTRFFSEATSF